MELLLVAGDMGLVVVVVVVVVIDEAFSMLLTFTPSQGGVFYCSAEGDGMDA